MTARRPWAYAFDQIARWWREERVSKALYTAAKLTQAMGYERTALAILKAGLVFAEEAQADAKKGRPQ